jgi:ABC-type multidrug transport system fused ATPase/permease subunit
MNRRAAQLLYAPLSGYPWTVAAAFFCVLTTSLSQALIPVSIGGVYAHLFQQDAGKNQLLSQLHIQSDSTSHALALFFVLVGIRMVSGLGEKVLLSYLSGELVQHLRARLFHSLIATGAHQKDSAARKLVFFTSELTAVQNLFTRGMVGALADVLFMILASALLVMLDVRLGITVILFIPCCLVLFAILSQPIVRSVNARNDERAGWLQFVTTRLQAGIAIRALNRENKEMRRFNQLNTQLGDGAFRTSVLQAIAESLIPTLFFGLIGVLLWQAAHAEHTAPHATLTTFILMLLYKQRTFRRIVKLPAVWRTGLHSLSKISARITTNGPEDREDAAKKTNQQLSIRDVVIVQATDNLPSRTVNAEHNGPGLTAFLSNQEHVRRMLTQRLLALTEGAGDITLDGISYNELGAFAVRKKIAVCSPQVPLYGRKVVDAICWNTTPEDRHGAAALLAAYDLWSQREIEDVLDTPIHEGISFNTLKPLELARAELTGKRILVVEEPLAGCDPRTAAALVNRINHMAARTAVLYIGSHLPGGLQPTNTIYL